MTLPKRLFWGAMINAALGIVLISVLSGWFMRLAEQITGAQYSWPQISFMSAYPDHIRNGYFMFVSAVITTIVLISGVFALLFGASPGRAVCGLHYADASGQRGTAAAILKRVALIVMVALFILLAGPLLGFVFGPAADVASLVALGLGIVLAIWTLPTKGQTAESKVDKASGLRPVIRPNTKE